MDIFGVVICALCAVIFGALVKKSNREYAVLVALGAATVILLAVFGQLKPFIERLESLSGSGAFSDGYLEIMLKAVGIALVGQLAAHVCKDAGESALAYAVELAAKGAILAAALPLLLKVFEYLEEVVRF